MAFQERKYTWKVKSVTGEIQKNKNDIIKVSHAESGGSDYASIQIWHTNKDNISLPVKEKNITLRKELIPQLIEALEKIK